MKQCASCGKIYAQAQANCPKCYTRGWVQTQEDQSLTAVPSNPTPCAECGFMAEPGTVKCPHCKGRLRPFGLEMLCFLALLGTPIAVVTSVLDLMNNPRIAWSDLALAVANAILAVAVFIISLGLLKGSYPAWQRMRLALIAAPSLLMLLYLIALIVKDTQFSAIVSGMLFFRLVGAVLLWFYFQHDTVTDFCADGKPLEVSGHIQSLFPEQQMRKGKVQVDSLYVGNRL